MKLKRNENVKSAAGGGSVRAKTTHGVLQRLGVLVYVTMHRRAQMKRKTWQLSIKDVAAAACEDNYTGVMVIVSCI